ncbi:MAG: hypothetical protein KAR00_03440 [Candidatus Pacebacteria bacterium]|nr:hypothetical protein [Candidatus Paceibacterota bacterium]
MSIFFKKAGMVIAVSLVVVVGYVLFYPDDRPYKPPIKEIPLKCQEFQSDTCALFDCMVDQCWCDDFFSPVLAEEKTKILNEEGAIALMEQYLENNDSEYNDVRKAIALNGVFFNVFVYNPNGDEKVFTVRTDGTIIVTVCGV